MGGFLLAIAVIVFLWAVVGIIRPAWARLPGRMAAVGVWIASVVLFGLAGSMLPDQPSSPSQSNSSSSARPAPAARPPAPQPNEVALLSMRGGDGGYGFHTVEGQVQNLTDSNLENVMAVVTWYTDDDQFITSDETLIEYNPILPDQTSPFEVMSRSNPAMSRYRVEFKTMFGGTLRQEDQR